MLLADVSGLLRKAWARGFAASGYLRVFWLQCTMISSAFLEALVDRLKRTNKHTVP